MYILLRCAVYPVWYARIRQGKSSLVKARTVPKIGDLLIPPLRRDLLSPPLPCRVGVGRTEGERGTGGERKVGEWYTRQNMAYFDLIGRLGGGLLRRPPMWSLGIGQT